MCKYEEELLQLVNLNKEIIKVLQVLKESMLLSNYYVVAGCITNTVWNCLSGYPIQYGISDVDIVYFDDSDLSHESELKNDIVLNNRLVNFPFKLDVKNQARVHLWYKKKFGFSIKPYTSVEDAIDTWPGTATSLGIRIQENGTYKIYAPYQLDDLFSMIVRPNKLMITPEIYESKAVKWKRKWPNLTIIPW